MTNVTLIETAKSLEAFVARAEYAPWLGLDTEFVRDRTYYPLPGLIQIATPDEIALVDPVRLDNLEPLASLLFETPATKILHAAYQDMELFQHLFGRVPAPLFDTQEAATAVGLSSQIGHAALVQELLGAETPDPLGRYDWLRRPLSPRAVEYAAGDVARLGELHTLLSARLRDSGKAEDFEKTMRERAAPEFYRPNPAQAWQRIRAARKLDAKELVRLKRLAAWRESQAMEENRPRQWIVGDGVLATLARLAPRHDKDLENLRALSANARRRYGLALLKLLAECSN